MPLPKGLIKQATGTITIPNREEPLSVPAVSSKAKNTAQPNGVAPATPIKKSPKKRVHYTLEADLIEFAEEAWRSFRRADGSRLSSTSEHIA